MASGPWRRPYAGAAAGLHGSLLLKAIAAGRQSQAGHAPAQADCVRLRAFQRQDGHPRCSSVRLHFVRAVLPFAEYLSMWAFFCAWGTAEFPVSPVSRLLSPPTPALFFCTFSVARLYRRFPLWRVQTFAPPHSPGTLPGRSVPSYRSPGAAPVPSGSQLPASSPTALHQGGECRCGRSWRPYLAQHITAVTRHKGHATSGTDALQE